jgi:arsenate reductase
MAEALVNYDLGDRFAAYSAGTDPQTPHPLAIKVLDEIGIDHGSARSKSIDEFAGQAFDFVITLCDSANETCPLFFGGVRRAHLGFDDPAKAEGTEEEKLIVFRRVRDEIRSRIEAFLTQSQS